MIELIISTLFIIWLIISAIYCFKSSVLGTFGKWLHRYGWVNQWSMYIQHGVQKDGGTIYYRDLENKEDDADWILIITPPSSILFLINKEARLHFFYNKCYRKLLHQTKISKERKCDFPFFNYLCAVVLEIPNTSDKAFRQVRIDRFSSKNNKKESFLQSDFIALT